MVQYLEALDVIKGTSSTALEFENCLVVKICPSKFVHFLLNDSRINSFASFVTPLQHFTAVLELCHFKSTVL